MNSTSARTLRILNLLGRSENPLTLSQISEGIGAPVSSTCSIVSTMLELGFLCLHDPRMKTYSVGIRAYEAGIAYIRNTSFVDVAKPFLKKMSLESETTTFLAVRNGDQIVYLDKVESSRSVRTTAVLGSYKDMYFSGLGKAILADLQEQAVRELYAGKELKAWTDKTICDIELLLADLRRTRERGYAIDDREGEFSLYCIAAPLRNHAGRVIASISIASFYDFLTDERLETNARLLTDSALAISKMLGYPGTSLY